MNNQNTRFRVFFFDFDFFVEKFTHKKNPRFWGKPRIEIGYRYIFYKMFNHLLETDYRRINFMNHVGYCIVM